MNKRILALLLAICLTLSAVPVYAGAATGQVVSANAVTVTAGNSVTVTLKAENFTGVAALDVYVYYDTAALSVSSTSNGTMLSGAQASVNTAEAGKITLSMVTLTPVTGTGNLMTVRFSAKASCAPGVYPVTVAIGRAYGETFQPVEVSGVSGSVTVNQPVSTETFSLYSYRTPSSGSLQKGDVLTYRVASQSSSRSFVSGEFVVRYDHEVFAFEEATLESALTGEGAMYSVNSSVLGQVRIAYANDDPVKSFYLFSVKLKVIADADTTTTVKAEANNMYRQDLTSYLPGSTSMNLTIVKIPQVVDLPDAYLTTQKLITGQQSSSVFTVEAGANIAAGDFTVSYNPAVFRCTGVEPAPGIADKGGMLIINENFGQGKIRFSYVNTAPTPEELALVKILWEPLQSPSGHYQLSASGKGVVDLQQNPIALEYVTDSGCIFVPTVTAPTCTEGGYTTYACACGESYQAEPVDALGHDVQSIEGQAPTCTEAGWSAGEKCSRCDHGTYETIAPLGHALQTVQGKEPTCEEPGWYTYQACSRCTYSTYQERPAKGHFQVSTYSYEVTPLSFQNDGNYPFTKQYSSTNRDDSSASVYRITVSTFFQLDLSYGVSSEEGYDWFRIYHNGSLLDEISGEVTDNRLPLSLYPGDTVEFQYEKDGSTAVGQDCGWFRIECDLGDDPSLIDFENDSAYPFLSMMQSTNHDDGSCAEYIIWCEYDCALQINYGVSSEQSYDWLNIECDGSNYVCISGEETGSVDLYMYAGQMARISYSKDGSGANGMDAAWFELIYEEKIWVEGEDWISTDNLNPTCTYSVVCSVCRETVKPALGHENVSYEAKAPTCTEAGWEAYEVCSRCSASNKRTLPALGHDLITHEAQAPTCYETGWKEYETCSRCDHSTLVELPAAGHRILREVDYTIDPLQVENTAFQVVNGVYHSQNHDNSSSSEFTVTATHDCSLKLVYGVSSETNYDKLYILHNGEQKVMISGVYSGRELSLELDAGDVITVRYAKDGSVNANADKGWVELQYEWLHITHEDVPAEEIIPDCSGSVVCDYCHETVAEAAAHTAQSAVFFWNDDHTGCQAELSCSVCLQTVLKDCVITDAPSEPGVTVHIASVTEGESTFTDMLTCENFRVTFLDRDGSAICKDWYHPGRSVVIPQLQERAAQDGFVFTFTGWDKEVSPVCTENAVYTATYEATLLGDVNGDGQVDTRDRAILTRFLANWEGYEINALAADVNMDGQVDTTDRAILTRHLANWQDYMQLPYIQP